MLRSRDREVNFKNFPHVDYSEIYLLEGGYCNFYPQYPVRKYFIENIFVNIENRNFVKVDI